MMCFRQVVLLSACGLLAAGFVTTTTTSVPRRLVLRSSSVEELPTQQVMSELKAMGVSTVGLFERRSLVERLESARKEERIRSAVEFSRRRRINERTLERSRVAILSEDEVRSILRGRGVLEASDRNVPVDLLVDLLTELRLGESLPWQEQNEFSLEEVGKNMTKNALSFFQTLARKPVVANNARIFKKAVAKRPRLIPFALNRFVDAVLQVGLWAGSGVLDSRVVVGFALLAAFTKHGLLASLAVILLFKISTDLVKEFTFRHEDPTNGESSERGNAPPTHQ